MQTPTTIKGLVRQLMTYGYTGIRINPEGEAQTEKQAVLDQIQHSFTASGHEGNVPMTLRRDMAMAMIFKFPWDTAMPKPEAANLEALAPLPLKAGNEPVVLLQNARRKIASMILSGSIPDVKYEIKIGETGNIEVTISGATEAIKPYYDLPKIMAHQFHGEDGSGMLTVQGLALTRAVRSEVGALAENLAVEVAFHPTVLHAMKIQIRGAYLDRVGADAPLMTREEFMQDRTKAYEKYAKFVK